MKQKEKKPLDPQEQAIVERYMEQIRAGEIPQEIQGVDMTPKEFCWQEVDTVYLSSFSGKAVPELHNVIDEITKKHSSYKPGSQAYGSDVRLGTHSYTTGGGWSMRTDSAYEGTPHTDLKVLKYLPVDTHEQYIAKRNQRLQDFSKAFAKQQEESKKNAAKRQKELIAKLKATKGWQDGSGSN